MSALARYSAASHKHEVTRAMTSPGGPRLLDKTDSSYIASGQIAGDFRQPLWNIYDRLRTIETWTDGWNGYEALAPSQKTIENARAWISQMYLEIPDTGMRWKDPYVTADVDGEVLLEWRAKDKSLFIYIAEDEATYIKDLGAEVGSEMIDGDASTSQSRRKLWEWFTG